MFELSDTIERKFVDSIDIDDWEIETHTGWVDITHINKTVEYDVWILDTVSGIHLECADNHIVFTSSNEQVFVKDLKFGDTIKGQHGDEIVASIIKTDRKENMYDLSVDGDHTYFAEGLLHHNTTTTAAFCLWQILFIDNYTVALLADKAATATEILTRVKDMYENLPVWLQKGIKRWNMKDILLENGSKIFCAATTPRGIRGKTVSCLVVDEAAIIPNNIADAFFTSTFPVISSGQNTKILVMSTPMGYNHFWKMWNEAIQNINGFNPVQVKWWEHPFKDQEWADGELRRLGPIKYAQEVECSFIGSSYTLVDGKKIATLSPATAIQKDEHLSIYEQEQKDHNYVMVIDPSEGIGGDYAAINIIDVTSPPYKQVATYRNNLISPITLPDYVYGLAKKYNEAFILCEINKFESVAETLYNEYEYEKMFVVTVMGEDQIVNNGFGKKIRCGVYTDKKVKRIGCSNLKELIETDNLLIRDSRTITELASFIRKKDSFAADDGYTDDLVMTLVLFSWLTKQEIFSEISKGATRKDLFKTNIQRAFEELMPFGFIVDGTEDENSGWVDVPNNGWYQ